MGTPLQQLMAMAEPYGPTPVTVGAKNAVASAPLMTGTGYVRVISYGETSGSAGALFYLHDGVDTTGAIIAVLAQTSGASGDVGGGLPGIPFRLGLYLERVSGQMSVAVTYVPLLNPLP